MKTILFKLPESLKEQIGDFAKTNKKTNSQVIREALATYLENNKKSKRLNIKEAIERYAGIWKNRKDMADPEAYLRNLRKKWIKQIPSGGN